MDKPACWVLTDDGWETVRRPEPPPDTGFTGPSILDKAGPHVPRDEEIDETPSLRGSNLMLALFVLGE